MKRFDLVGSTKSVFDVFAEALSHLIGSKSGLPLLFYLVFKILVMLLYLASITEPWSTFWASLMRGVSGNFLCHYPIHLIFMQTILGRLDVALDIFIHVVFQGATIMIIAAAHGAAATTLTDAFRTALRRYPQLVAVTAITSLGMLAFVYAPQLVLGGAARAAGSAITTVVPLGGLAVQAALLYSMPSVLLRRPSIPGSIGESIGLAWRTITATGLLVIVPFLLALPTVFLGSASELISLRLSPDFMIPIYVAGEVMHFLCAYLTVAGATLFYIRSARRDVVEGTIPAPRTEPGWRSVDVGSCKTKNQIARPAVHETGKRDGSP